MTCYRCRNLPTYRLVALTRPWWRRWLRLGHQVWLTCPEHRYDPIQAGQKSRMVVFRHD
jgi:hypothetical protein